MKIEKWYRAWRSGVIDEVDVIAKTSEQILIHVVLYTELPATVDFWEAIQQPTHRYFATEREAVEFVLNSLLAKRREAVAALQAVDDRIEKLKKQYLVEA